MQELIRAAAEAQITYERLDRETERAMHRMSKARQSAWDHIAQTGEMNHAELCEAIASEAQRVRERIDLCEIVTQ